MFPITISFTVSTPAELDRLVAATEFTAPATDEAAIQKSIHQPAEKPATEPAKKPEKPAAAKSAPPADTPATPAPTDAASGELDYDKDVKPAFLKLVQSKGRAAGRKIIDAFAPTKEKLSEAITTQEQFGQALKLIAKEMGA